MRAAYVPASGSPSSQRVFYTLDALRGIAALAVVAFHFNGLFAPLRAGSGYLAVDLFFMMSGVVIWRAYDSRFQGGMSVREFMRIRAIRLYPLYLLGTVLGFLMAAGSLFGRNVDGWTAKSLVVAMLSAIPVIPNVYGHPNARLFPLDTPCWSLFLEFLVNLLFAFIWRRLTGRGLAWLCATTGIGVIATIVLTGSIDQGYTWPGLLPGIIRTAFGFSVGVAIGRYVVRDRRPRSALAFLAICAAIVIALTAAPVGLHRQGWDAACVLIIFPLAVCASVFVEPPRWLQGTAAFLGLTSYAVYVLHGSLLTAANAVLHRVLPANAGQGAPYSGLALAAGLLAACWLIDRVFDTPVRSRLTRRRGAEGLRSVAA